MRPFIDVAAVRLAALDRLESLAERLFGPRNPARSRRTQWRWRPDGALAMEMAFPVAPPPFGITLRNSIMMVSHYEHLVEAEERRWDAETAVEGAADRLVPILMTSLAFILGVVPLVLATGAGRAGRISVVTTVFGGMIAATTLNLLFIPVLYVIVKSIFPGGRAKTAAVEH